MTVHVHAQLASLTGAVSLGLLLGLFYDLLRVIRVRLPVKWLGYVLDLLFWCVCTLTLFLWSVTTGGGLVRIYIVAALTAGCYVYFRVLSPLTLPLLYRCADVWTAAVTALLRPLGWLAGVLKRIGIFFKNHFHFEEIRYRIRVLFVGQPPRL